MKLIERDNPESLAGALPSNGYNELDNSTLKALLATFDGVPLDVEGDLFGKIYEYFLGKFALAEGQRGGEFFTPTSIVKLIVEIIEPYRGEAPEYEQGSPVRMQEHFSEGRYVDIPGLCKVATLTDIEAQGWSLNPGRYVGVAERAAVDFDFKEKLEELHEELILLNSKASTCNTYWCN
jgi:type I restriction-modification system DNA methylase subunit